MYHQWGRAIPSTDADCYAAGMGSDDRSSSTQVAMFWVLLALAAGAAIGIGTAAALLARKDRPLPDDPDAPLFI